MRENFSTLDVDVEVPGEVLDAAGRVLNAATVYGARYNEATLAEIDTECCGWAG